MTTDSLPLLAPWRIGNMTLPNRVLMAPMTRARATNAAAAPTALHEKYYTQRSSAGMIITEGTWISERAVGYLHSPGIYSAEQTSAWTRVVSAVHDAGGHITLQLGHAGAKAHPENRNGQLPAGPSAINPQEDVLTATGPKQTLTPRAFTTEEIEETIADYRAAAENAHRAGFDGVEIHAQGPQLIGQFLNPQLNRRTDTYGGSIKNRSNFLLQVITELTSILGENRVSVKLSPYFTNGRTFQVADETLAGFDHVADRLNDSSLSFLHLMGPPRPRASAKS